MSSPCQSLHLSIYPLDMSLQGKDTRSHMYVLLYQHTGSLIPALSHLLSTSSIRKIPSESAVVKKRSGLGVGVTG